MFFLLTSYSKNKFPRGDAKENIKEEVKSIYFKERII